ncbi:hypothetical protein BKI52_25890 [marine bacterium AO1-C]|nr:hypothetical protein BKI52_25890 [marine bacterium AO1-C]
MYQKIFIALLFLTVLTLPFHELLNSYSIILLSISWLSLVIFQRAKLVSPFNTISLSLIGFYLLHVIGLIYTPSQKLPEANFNLEVKMTFVIFPLILSSASNLISKYFRKLLTTFAISCIIASFICVSNAVYKNYLLNQLKSFHTFYFTNHEFVNIINQHASYFALYICFSIYIITYDFLKSKNKSTLTTKTIRLSSIFFLLLILTFAGSRMMLIGFIVCSFAGIFWYFYAIGRLLRGIIVGVLITSITVAVFFSNPGNITRLKKIINYKGLYNDKGQYAHSGFQLRLNIWDCASELAQKKIFWGYGTGEAQTELTQCYRDKDYAALYYWVNIKKGPEFNAHNEFLQTTLTLGLLGLLTLIGILILFTYKVIVSRNYMGLSFIILFFFIMITEAVFKTQKGVVFFNLFAMITLTHSASYSAINYPNKKQN